MEARFPLAGVRGLAGYARMIGQAQGGASAARGTPERSHVQTQLPVPFAVTDRYGNAAGSPVMACTREDVALHGSPRTWRVLACPGLQPRTRHARGQPSGVLLPPVGFFL